MPKVYFLRGLPASGKTTRAEQIYEQDGKPYNDIIWKKIRPHGANVFKIDEL